MLLAEFVPKNFCNLQHCEAVAEPEWIIELLRADYEHSHMHMEKQQAHTHLYTRTHTDVDNKHTLVHCLDLTLGIDAL